jgi:FkbH-like protein
MQLKEMTLGALLNEAADPLERFNRLKAWLTPDRRYVEQLKVAKAVEALLPSLPALKPLRIGLVSSFTTNYFVEVLKLWLRFSGIEPQLYVAPFDMVTQTLLDGESELYRFQPDVIWILTTHRDLRWTGEVFASQAALEQRVDEAVEAQRSLWAAVQARSKAVVLQSNADVPPEDAYGNFSGASALGARTAMRRYNEQLARQQKAGVVIVDVDHLSSLFGKARWADRRNWYLAKTAFNLDAAGLVACSGARLIAAAKGLAKKCLVLDLDNTLWGGVIGDDGLNGIKLGMGAEGEAFVAFQQYVKQLGERGVILAVCSKNEEANAKEPFEKHPDMRLRLEDIAVFKANWENKADNIRGIAKALNIGTDALLFVDDNPTERALVRKYLPEVEVPELPEEPAEYVAALAETRWFETVALSDDDRERGRFYRENALRDELSQKFVDAGEFLKSLQMRAEARPLDAYSLPRVAQLINKSNQFHLTTTRYSEAQVEELGRADGCDVLHFRLVDRFGDNGIIAGVILQSAREELVIDTWVMSCRVLARTMEEFTMNEILAVARRRGARRIVGVYRPTAKNKLVEGHYRKLGFDLSGSTAAESRWVLELKPETAWTTHVGREG